MGKRTRYRSVPWRGMVCMSTPFMLAIAVMYLGAGVCFAWEGKAAWTGLTLSWAVGNFILAYISK